MNSIKKLTFLLGLLLSSNVFSQNPTIEWSKMVQDTISDTLYSSVYGVTTDRQSNAYIVGAVSQNNGYSVAGGLCLAKYDSLGNRLWKKEFLANNQSTYGAKIKVSSSGSIFVIGQLEKTLRIENIILSDSSDNTAGFLAKFNSEGNILWGRVIKIKPKANCPSFFYSVGIHDFDLDRWENIYLSGDFSDTVNFGNQLKINTLERDTCKYNTDIFLVKYNTDGLPLWAKNFNARQSSNTMNYFRSYRSRILVDSIGNIYTAGCFQDTLFSNVAGVNPLVSAGGTDMFWIKYDASGNMIWRQTAGTAQDNYIGDIVLSKEGSLYLTGYNYSNNVLNVNIGGIETNNQYFIVKINPNVGTAHWIAEGGGNSITFDKQGRMYAYYWRHDAAPLAFFGEYNPANGSTIWQTSDIMIDVRDVEANNSIGCYIVGKSSFNSNMSIVNIKGDFISKIKSNTSITSIAKNQDIRWNLYPNPSKGGFFVTEISTNSEVSVIDVLGKELYSSKLSAGKHEIRLAEASSGVYFVRVSNVLGVSVKKLVIE